MPYRDLRHFAETLEARGLLRRVRVPVDRDLEISEITDRVSKRNGPALWFESVKGSDVPLLINAFGSVERLCVALDVESFDGLAAKVEDLLTLADDKPKTFFDKLKLLPKLGEIARFFPKEVNEGPCQELVETAHPSLAAFPIPTCWPEDGGRYITYPLVFTHDPETGKRNCGTYRMQVYDERTTALHMHLHKDAMRHFQKSSEKRQRMEVAVAIGSDPAVCFAAIMPLPPDVDEMILAGFLRGDPVKMVRAKTVDVLVPANAEIVLEGYVDPAESRVEGPFGDHTGFYSLADDYPVFHLTAVTRRRQPIYHSILVGRPPQEDCWLGRAIERLALPVMRRQFPEIVDVNMPFEGVFHNLMIVSIKKRYPGHARKIMHGIWGLGQAMFTKVIVVVEDDTNVHDLGEVAWKALNHIDPERDLEFVMGPVETLDHASRLPWYGSKVGVDATRKWKEEGFAREWPNEIVMSPEVRDLVSRRWDEYGLSKP
ncbi:MAG: menaquinone biosynthesis decarboxylase [Planctomycetes bacterium]|nr:menaquinone biosynthesis decarboxylase [Planctomycetota bacterium]